MITFCHILIQYISEWSWNNDTARYSTSSWYLNILLKIDTKLHVLTLLDITNGMIEIFPIKFPHQCSKIPSSGAYGVYISQMVQYARTCTAYAHFLIRDRLPTNRLILQTFHQFYGSYNYLVCHCNIPWGHMLSDKCLLCQLLVCSWHSDFECKLFCLIDLEIGFN
jgi:hypothetical protein